MLFFTWRRKQSRLLKHGTTLKARRWSKCKKISLQCSFHFCNLVATVSLAISLFMCSSFTCSGPGSSISVATELRARRSGIESRWGRVFSPVQTGPGAHPTFCTMGTRSFPGVKCDRGVLLTTHPLLVPRSWKSRAIPLPTLWATPGL